MIWNFVNFINMYIGFMIFFFGYFFEIFLDWYIVGKYVEILYIILTFYFL